ncbi:NRAMP family [Phytophthora cactorum]|nr:NRAMP family [Phytophthora cactorum]
MTSTESASATLPPGRSPALTDSTAEPRRSRFSWSVFWSYTGPGWLMSMAYLDPGNLEADLQSGAYTRYQLLYVVLLSTIFGGLYQYPPLVSFGLWIMTELAIIGSDIQEVLGSAVAFELLFGLPLWLGCLLTGLDTFTFLAIHKAGDSKSRYLEMFFLLLIATMCVCFFADFTMSDPDGMEIIKGVVEPRLDKQNTMQAVAMVGAIIMPHNIFLHSALVQERKIDTSFLINAAVVCAFASSFFSSQCYALSSNPISSLYGRDIQTSCIPTKAALSSGSAIYDAFSGNVCVFGGESVFGGNVTAKIMNTVSKCSPCYVDGHGIPAVALGSGPTAGYCQEIGLAEAGEAVREDLEDMLNLNYSLVYDILIKNLPEKFSLAAWIGLVTIAGLYVSLLLYLLLIYPSETVPSHYVVLSSASDSELLPEKQRKRTGSAEELLLDPAGASAWRTKVSYNATQQI